MKVRIKTWDDMVDEFGLALNGNIRNGFFFHMEEDMPEDRIIQLTNMVWNSSFWGYWDINDNMIAEILED